MHVYVNPRNSGASRKNRLDVDERVTPAREFRRREARAGVGTDQWEDGGLACLGELVGSLECTPELAQVRLSRVWAEGVGVWVEDGEHRAREFRRWWRDQYAGLRPFCCLRSRPPQRQTTPERRQYPLTRLGPGCRMTEHFASFASTKQTLAAVPLSQTPLVPLIIPPSPTQALPASFFPSPR